jgi:hypothetical protein
MTELHWGVRVQYALMAAVLIGPTTKTTTTTSHIVILILHFIEIFRIPWFLELFQCKMFKNILGK